MYANSNEGSQTWPEWQGTASENNSHTQNGSQTTENSQQSSGHNTEGGAYAAQPISPGDDVYPISVEASGSRGYYDYNSGLRGDGLTQGNPPGRPHASGMINNGGVQQSWDLPNAVYYGGNDLSQSITTQWSSTPVDSSNRYTGYQNVVATGQAFFQPPYEGSAPTLPLVSNHSGGTTTMSPTPDSQSPAAPTQEGAEFRSNLVACDNCGATLSGQHAVGNLTRHRRSKACQAAGTSPTQWKCPECTKIYQRSDALLNHRRRRHGAPPSQPKHASFYSQN